MNYLRGNMVICMRLKYRSLVLLLVFLMSSCQAKSSVVTHYYLSRKYGFEDCADIHGKNISSEIFFNKYLGDSYAYLFDLSNSYLDMRTKIDGGKAIGIGELNLKRQDDPSFSINKSFTYYCVLTSTSSGNIISDIGDEFDAFVFCIYWCRLNLKFTNPENGELFTLTLQFSANKGSTQNEYPSEFDNY